MSHITKIEAVKIKDLTALRQAVEECGLVLTSARNVFKAYRGQRHECDAVIYDATNSEAYEAGVVKQADGTFQIQMDNWRGGYGLNEKIGENASKLTQVYTANVTANQLKREGWRVQKRWQEGVLKVTATK